MAHSEKNMGNYTKVCLSVFDHFVELALKGLRKREVHLGPCPTSVMEFYCNKS